jgi:hypothetical protein
VLRPVCSVLQIFLLINTTWTKIKKERKRTNLNVKEKSELIEKLETGVSVARVCEEYGHLHLAETR